MSDTEWVDWLTVSVNPIGYVEEKWWHAKGCGKWFTVNRHTVTHNVVKADEKSI
ncbi:sarcosine oxidase subunit delta [uncultured Candidatus Puniceispirillum sp.]|uniref:sarcosine oxidase subunit delta n=1 Tax=uncultured Candidatus Puniceispirillum sp. TaxID=1985115 RepID=UPI0032B2FA26